MTEHKCPRCSRIFTGRTCAIYCSDTCRKQAHTNRKRDAGIAPGSPAQVQHDRLMLSYWLADRRRRIGAPA